MNARPSIVDLLAAPNDGIVHVDGIAWTDAPIPPRWHFCRTQTYGFLGFVLMERCACGARRRGGRSWLNRNSRRLIPSDPHPEENP